MPVFYDFCESAGRSRFGGYAPMVCDGKIPLNLYPTGDRIGLADEGLEDSVGMVKFFPSGMTELYYGMRTIMTLDTDVLSKHKRYIMVRNGSYAEM